jgi:hypothetical protein
MRIGFLRDRSLLIWRTQTLIGLDSRRVSSRTETSMRHEHKQMNDDENKPADKDAPRGTSDELVDWDTFDITDDPGKEEEEPLESHNKPS